MTHDDRCPRLGLLRLYLSFLATFTLFWWPLSHWFYPHWYHHLLGFTHYDPALVKIIGTLGAMPVAGMFLVARSPLRNRDMLVALLLLFVLLLLRPALLDELLPVSRPLLDNMMLLFVPVSVGIVQQWPLLEARGGALLTVLVLSQIIGFAATAFTMSLLLRVQRRRRVSAAEEEHADARP